MFKDKILLITGGTGSFGNAVLKRFLHSDFAEIRIFSRDEKKQEDMRIALQERQGQILHRRRARLRQRARRAAGASTTCSTPRR